MNVLRLVIFAAAAATLWTAAPAHTQTPQGETRPQNAASLTDSAIEARTSAIAATLRCPVCQGESIQDSPSDLAQSMRRVVRDKVRAGESPEQIKAYFASKYGEWILLEPKMTGLNVLLYILPVLLILGGLAFVIMLVRRWTSPPKDNTTHGSE